MKRSSEGWARAGSAPPGLPARSGGRALRTLLLLVAAIGGWPAPSRGGAPENAAPPPSLVRLELPEEADQRYPIGIPTDPAQSVELAFPWPLIDWAGRGFTPDPETYAGDFLVDARRGSPRLFVTPLVQGGRRVLHVVLGPPGTAPRTVLLEFLPAPPESAWSKVTFVAAASARPRAAAADSGDRGAPPEDAAAANVRSPVIRTLRPAPSPDRTPTPEVQLGLIRTMRLVRTLPLERARALVAADPALEWDDRQRAPRSFGPFVLRLAFALRDRTTDCLGLCVDVRNATRRRLIFDAESWVVRAGERVYPLRTADFANEIEPEAAAVAWLVLGRAQDGSPTRLLPATDFQVSVKLTATVNPHPVLRFPLAGLTANRP